MQMANSRQLSTGLGRRQEVIRARGPRVRALLQEAGSQLENQKDILVFVWGVCVYMCVCDVCPRVCRYVCPRVCLEVREGGWVSSLIAHSLSPLRRGFSLNAGPGWRLARPGILLSPAPAALRLQAHMATPSLLCGCWEFELRFSCLLSKHSYLLSLLLVP